MKMLQKQILPSDQQSDLRGQLPLKDLDLTLSVVLQVLPPLHHSKPGSYLTLWTSVTGL